MNKKKLIILGVIIFILVISGITYAIYTWSDEGTNIKGNAECFIINYAKGEDIGSDQEEKTLMISNTYTGGLSTTMTISLDSKCTITGKGELYLETDSVTSETLLSNNLLKYQVMLNGTSNVGSGTITQSGKIPIYSNIPITNTAKKITVYVWIDENVVDKMDNSDQLKIIDTIYKGKLSMKAIGDDK